MTRHERRVLHCAPTTAVPQPGDYQRQCKDCGRGLWVEALLIEHVDTGDVEPLCSACVHGELVRCDEVAVGLLPGQEWDFPELGITAQAGQEVLRARRRSDAYRWLMDGIEGMVRDER